MDVMKRTTMLVLVVAVAMVLSAPMAAATGAFTDDNDTDDEEITAGERLNGAIGAQQAEIDGDLQERSYGIAVANAATDEEAADVVAERFDAIDQRLDDLDERLAELEATREAGEISHGQYAAQVAGIEAERGSLERQADQVNQTAGELPAGLLEERGINAEAIKTLKDRANELGGENVSTVAQSIAGPDVGQGVAGDQRPGDAGPPSDDDDRGAGDRGNGTDRGADDRDDGADREDGDEEQDGTDQEQDGDADTDADDTEESDQDTENQQTGLWL